MKKVAINKCYGGFSISAEAAKILAMKESPVMEVETVKEWCGGEELPDYYSWVDVGDGYEASVFIGKPSDMLKKDGIIYDFPGRSADRGHPDLIQVIEDLGDGANGACAQIKIVEIPDGVDYSIEEYDGIEWIAEKHETWG